MPIPVVTLAQIYAAEALDRAAHRRRDADWLAAARAAPTSRVVLLSELRFALLGTDEAPLLHAPTVAELGAALPPEAIFLGERAGGSPSCGRSHCSSPRTTPPCWPMPVRWRIGITATGSAAGAVARPKWSRAAMRAAAPPAAARPSRAPTRR